MQVWRPSPRGTSWPPHCGQNLFSGWSRPPRSQRGWGPAPPLGCGGGQTWGCEGEGTSAVAGTGEPCGGAPCCGGFTVAVEGGETRPGGPVEGARGGGGGG